MKIYKSPAGMVYDTENPSFSVALNNPAVDVKNSLHHHHDLTDFEFLSSKFDSNHPILIDFPISYYFVLD